MGLYRNILLATELTEHSEIVAAKARELANETKATLSALHVVVPVAAYAMAYCDSNLHQLALEEATMQLDKLCAQFDIDPDNQHIGVGSPKHVILDLAQKIKADLIIVGSHENDLLSILHGSTVNAVLSGAKGDVLTVNIHQVVN